MAVRPVFQDRVLEDKNGNNRAQFDILDPFLPLLNDVKQDGTFMTAGQMNNLLHPGNLASFGNSRTNIVRQGRNLTLTTTETIMVADGVNGDKVPYERIVQIREVVHRGENVWDYRDRLYDNVYSEELGITHHTMVQDRRGTLTRHRRGNWTVEMQ